MSRDPWFQTGSTGLLTDLYEITMAACYFEQRMSQPATFSLFVRKLPQNRSFLLAAGLEEALDYLENLRFGPQAIDYLRSTGHFKEPFLKHLAELRFSGEVVAVAEGTPIFPDEPLLEVTAPIMEAQLAETYLMNAIQLGTLIASKAARIRFAARDKTLMDFASRRAQGRDAALKVARSSFIGGCNATSNVLAGMEYGIPVQGTLAHSFVQSFQEEIEAFRAFARVFPDDAVLLIDTYDTLEGARRAVKVGKEMARQGAKLRGVRLDSGDMVHLAKEVRRILDDGGLTDAKILASGSLDEYRIEDALAAGAPIDGFGVGSHLGVSSDAPVLDIVYKLVEYNHRPVLKLSQDKQTLAGRKQIFRRYAASGRMEEDVLALREEKLDGLQALLTPVMKGGKRLAEPPALPAIQQHAAESLSKLPSSLRALRGTNPYLVRRSEAIRELQSKLVEEHGGMVSR
ncbi:MAG TPA: nicotinate phosphoribosyltransferase [Vicinamibacteria bacterium]|nr:nicotinate phosphoribosyltransferase [Vicinamibacteria bacterium]